MLAIIIALFISMNSSLVVRVLESSCSIHDYY